jgi:hypothetical protein
MHGRGSKEGKKKRRIKPLPENSQRSMSNASTRHPNHQTPRDAIRALTIAKLGRLIDELIESWKHIVRELDLSNGPHPLGSASDREASDSLLGERRIENPLAAKLGRKAHAAAEHAPKGHILSE